MCAGVVVRRRLSPGCSRASATQGARHGVSGQMRETHPSSNVCTMSSEIVARRPMGAESVAAGQGGRTPAKEKAGRESLSRRPFASRWRRRCRASGRDCVCVRVYRVPCTQVPVCRDVCGRNASTDVYAVLWRVWCAANSVTTTAKYMCSVRSLGAQGSEQSRRDCRPDAVGAT